MKVLSIGLRLPYLLKRGFCVNEDMDNDDGVSDDVSGGEGDGSSEGVGTDDSGGAGAGEGEGEGDGAAGGAVGGHASVIGGVGGGDNDNSACSGIDADGH